MIGYAILYYRGLFIVVVASLAIVGAFTYAIMVLLGESVGFALNLPGIAGAIIAIGLTADSFIIFFERIRDEMREGKTMRVAVESGWKRAKVTRLAANVVSFPHGLFHGRVTPAMALPLVHAYAEGRIHPAGFRGRAAWRR